MINFNKFLTKKKAFVPFITAGDPSIDKTKEFIKALIEAGSTIIEIGIPFSDPIAEGKTIMEADERALKAGATTDKIFDMVKEITATSYLDATSLTSCFSSKDKSARIIPLIFTYLHLLKNLSYP